MNVPRCDARSPLGRRCAKPRGHAGPHESRDSQFWQDEVRKKKTPSAEAVADLALERAAAVNDILAELARCQRKHEAFHSAHEGFAVLKEEVDELWDDVKEKLHDYDFAAMRGEAVQIAAQALRFIIDICDHPKKQPD